MTTSMHRLQISLPEHQVRYLSERARREGLSMAEVIRRLLADAAEGRRGRQHHPQPQLRRLQHGRRGVPCFRRRADAPRRAGRRARPDQIRRAATDAVSMLSSRQGPAFSRTESGYAPVTG